MTYLSDGGSTQGTCVAKAALGSSCSLTYARQCQSGTFCDNISGTGICQAQRAARAALSAGTRYNQCALECDLQPRGNLDLRRRVLPRPHALKARPLPEDVLVLGDSGHSR